MTVKDCTGFSVADPLTVRGIAEEDTFAVIKLEFFKRQALQVNTSFKTGLTHMPGSKRQSLRINI